MPSFDIICETDMQEISNAVNSAHREISTRYDFKDSNSNISLEDNKISILADDDLKLKNVTDILKTHITRRGLDVKCLDFQDPEKSSGNMIKQNVGIVQGIEQDIAKKINKSIKDSKLKIQSSIQGDKLRVNGKKRDDLQSAISIVKEMNIDIPLSYRNFRD